MPSDFQLRETCRHLAMGDVIAYPTEAVYGLGCEPLDGDAVYRLLAMKQRKEEKGLILVAADLQQLRPYLQPLSSQDMQSLQQTWPGPVTWIIPCRPEVPVWLRGRHDSLAVRVSAHPVVQAICRVYGGPIVSTSANISTHPPARSPLAVRRGFGTAVDYLVHGELGGARRPTQIRELRSGSVVREA